MFMIVLASTYNMVPELINVVRDQNWRNRIYEMKIKDDSQFFLRTSGNNFSSIKVFSI